MSMYDNDDDVPVGDTKTDNEIIMQIALMKEQYGAFMTKGAAS